MKIGFIGNFAVPFTTENDRKWSFEKLGHTVIPFQENETTVDMLKIKIMDLDFLLYSHTHGWNIEELKEFFVQYRGIRPTASVHLDRWAWLEREKDVGGEATWYTDLQFLADGSPEAVKLYKKHNLNWRWLQPGVIERDCYIAPPDHNRFPQEIIFVGSKGYHKEYPQRPQLIEFLQNKYGKRFGHYGGDGIGGTIRGKDLNTLYSTAKIVVGDSCFGGRPRYWSDRVTETVGRGGFLIHPWCQGMGQMPMHPYESNNFNDLEKAIEYWLARDKERNAKKIEAHEWVKMNATYTNRARELLQHIHDLTK